MKHRHTARQHEDASRVSEFMGDWEMLAAMRAKTRALEALRAAFKANTPALQALRAAFEANTKTQELIAEMQRKARRGGR